MQNHCEKTAEFYNLGREQQAYYNLLGTLLTYIFVGYIQASCYIEASCEHSVHRALFLYKKLSREICIPFDNFSETIVLTSERGKTRFLTIAMCRGEVILMELSPEQKRIVQLKFIRFCYKTLQGEAKHYWQELKNRSAHEILFSEMTESALEQIYTMDKYQIENGHFSVLGMDVEVNDSQITEALEQLPEKKRMVPYITIKPCL